MYSFRAIREAILAAEPPAGFPYGPGLTAERLRDIRAAPHLQEFLAGMRAMAARAQSEPAPPLPFSFWRLFETTGTRLEYERPYFARRGRLLALALAAIVDATDVHLDPLQDTIWAICDEYSWSVPAHLRRGAGPDRAGRVQPDEVVDLFAAETAHALAETLVLLGRRLDPWMAYRVRAEIERRVFRPLFHDPVHFDWESVPMNWASVCAGAAGMAALLLEPDRERLAGMVERCARALECFLEGYGDDGGCSEGIGYWQYGFGYYVYFAEMLHEYTGGRLDLLGGQKIRRIADFPAGVSLSAGSFVNYSDGQSRNVLATGLLSRLAARTGAAVPALARVPDFDGDHCYRWATATRNLLWTDPALLHGPSPTGTVVFDDLGWVVDRRAIGGVPVAFSAKGGHNGEPHNHNDLGHFILHVGGESLLADLGAGLYTRDYFGPQRYDHIHNSSAGHSVPLIAGQEQQAGRSFSAGVLQRDVFTDGLLFELDLKNAYSVEQLRRFVRSFRWSCPAVQGPARLVLTDAFAFDAAPPALEEIFISLHEPALSSGQVTWRGQRGAVALSYDTSLLQATVEPIATRDHHDQPLVVYRLRLAAIAPRAEEAFEFVFDTAVSATSAA
jgi:hypothetical protein